MKKSSNGISTAVINDAGISVNLPIRIGRRGGRKTMHRMDDARHRSWDNSLTPIQAALAHGHRWLTMLESGRFRTLTELAEHEGMDRAYVSRLVSLTLLAPDIVAAILDETLPSDVTLFELASGTPLLWEKQRAFVGRKIIAAKHSAKRLLLTDSGEKVI